MRVAARHEAAGRAASLPLRKAAAFSVLRFFDRVSAYRLERLFTFRSEIGSPIATAQLEVAPVIKGLQAAGAESLRAIAAGLNARGMRAGRDR
jgi:hypothetical protein